MIINVKEYNVDNTGLLDSRVGLQQAILDLEAAGGGILRIPKGTYLLGGSGNSFYSLIISSSNIFIEGDGPGVTILKQLNSPDNNLILFNKKSNKPLKNIGVSGITFNGCEPPGNPDDKPDVEKYALLVFKGLIDSYIENITINNCEFRNATRDAVFLLYVKKIRIQNNCWNYYDGFSAPASFPGTVHHCGVFSGGELVEDVVVIGNNFNGNVGGVSTSDIGADGFLWFSKGGNITVVGNTIRNYKLEAIQMNAGPATISNNVFDTIIGGSSATALLAYPDVANTDLIYNPVYLFSSNTVKGGSFGVLHKGGSFGSTNSVGDAPRYKSIINSNYFELNSNLVGTIVIGAIAAELLEIVGNIAKGGSMFFSNGVYPLQTIWPTLNFSIKNLLIEGNTHINAKSNGIFFQDPLNFQSSAIISNNKISRGNGFKHIDLAGTKNTEGYRVRIENNIYLDYNGKEEFPVISITRIDPSMDGVIIEQNYGRKFCSDFPPITGSSNYRSGDIIRNTSRGQGKVLFWESQNGGYFEPVFSAYHGFVAFALFGPNDGKLGRLILGPLSGQSPRVLNIEVLLQSSGSWLSNSGDISFIRIRRTPSLITVCDIPVAKIATKTLQNDIIYSNGILGAALGAGQGLEVVGWNGTQTTNGPLLASKILVAVSAVYEWA